MILLVTADPDTAAAAQQTAMQLHHHIRQITPGLDALSTLMDDGGDFSFAVIDLDRHAGTQTLFKTAAGMMPVVGITGSDQAGAQKITQRCHAVCHLQKPLQNSNARVAFARALHWKKMN